MRTFYNLLSYEIRNCLMSPTSYVTAVLFLCIMGFLYLFVLESFSESAQEGLPSTEFFKVFWIPVFFVVPLITMKSIAEERRQGTLDSLMATAVSPISIILSKFFSSYLFYMGIWALTLFFPFIIQYILPSGGVDPRLMDKASLYGGYSFIALSGLLYISLGIFASSLTKSQLVASIVTFTLIFMVMVSGPLLSGLPLIEAPWLSWLKVPLNYFQTFQHLEDFSRGLIDSRPFFFYISSSAFLLGITTVILENKN